MKMTRYCFQAIVYIPAKLQLFLSVSYLTY